MPEPLSAAIVTTLVESHRNFLSFLNGRLHDHALAEDLLQEAFVKSLEKGGALRDEGAAVAWFYRLLRNAVIDHHRRDGVRHRALDALARELADTVEPPHELHEAICGCVARLATTLKPEYAEILQRIEVEGATLAIYAAEAGITANNAAVRAHRAREALRKQVRASCGSCAEHGCLECTCGSAAQTELQA